MKIATIVIACLGVAAEPAVQTTPLTLQDKDLVKTTPHAKLGHNATNICSIEHGLAIPYSRGKDFTVYPQKNKVTIVRTLSKAPDPTKPVRKAETTLFFEPSFTDVDITTEQAINNLKDAIDALNEVVAQPIPDEEALKQEAIALTDEIILLAASERLKREPSEEVKELIEFIAAGKAARDSLTKEEPESTQGTQAGGGGTRKGF